jgi:hypothetical protein
MIFFMLCSILSIYKMISTKKKKKKKFGDEMMMSGIR